MDKIKKVYVDSRHKTNDSVNNSDFKFELEEALDLHDNTVWYTDDISIPHTQFTIEENMNNTLYIITTKMNTGIPTWYHSLALEIPTGKYTGSSLALALQAELQFAEPDHQFVCTYNAARGNITILSGTISLFNILIEFQVMGTTISHSLVWENKLGNDVIVDLNSLSIK